MLIDSEELKTLLEEYTDINTLRKKHHLFFHESIRKGVMCMAQLILFEIAGLEQKKIEELKRATHPGMLRDYKNERD